MANDKYDKAVEYLTANPKCIKTAWGNAISGHGGAGHDLTEYQHNEAHDRASCLFKNCGDIRATGCLTQIAHGNRVAETEKLTAAIFADRHRIPMDGDAIEIEDLQVFAEWRRRIDKEAKANG